MRRGRDCFGYAVAISGDTVVVGAPGEDSDGSSQGDNSASGAGAAYVFVTPGTITVVKQTVPDAAWKDFDFSGDLGDFTLSGSSNGSDDSQTFGGLPLGTYSITEDAVQGAWDLTDITCTPEGAASVDLANRTVTVTLDQSGAEVICTFKSQEQPDLHGLKYLDKDGDGAQDEGEDGLVGWAMALFRKTGSDPDTYLPFKKGSWWKNGTFAKLTDAEGLVKWWNFPVGATYLVCEVPQAGWVNTEPGADAIAYSYNDVDLICQEVTFAAGDYGTTKDVHFGNAALGQLTVVKDTGSMNAPWLDFGFTGDLGDFELNGGDDVATNRQTFENLALGRYSITESDSPGNWDLTELSCEGTEEVNVDLANKTVGVTLVEPGADVTCTFVNERRAKLQIEKYEDLNGNGTREAGEPGRRGWAMSVYHENNAGWEQVQRTKATNENGVVHFTGLATGEYWVCETPQEGWTNTEPGEEGLEFEGLICQEVSVAYGDMTKVVFGNVAKGTLTIIKEATPEGEEEFTFGGDLGAFTLVDDGSDANQVTFTDLMPGRYAVTETLRGKWSLLSVVCEDEGVETAYDLVSDTQGVLTGAAVTLGSGQDVACVYTNEKPDAVELAEVEAVVDGNAVTVRWRTLTEMETVGFNVMRSTSAEGLYEQANGTFIAARGEGFSGARYEFVDRAVEAGVTYYYYVQEVLATGGAVDYPEWTVSSTVAGAKLGGMSYTVYLPLARRE